MAYWGCWAKNKQTKSIPCKDVCKLTVLVFDLLAAIFFFPLNINRSFGIQTAKRLGEHLRKELPARRATAILHSGF